MNAFTVPEPQTPTKNVMGNTHITITLNKNNVMENTQITMTLNKNNVMRNAHNTMRLNKYYGKYTYHVKVK